MLEGTKFNVIIPTRERCNTLSHTLRTVVEQQYANLNIIVSDNFSSDSTRAVVESFADPRITYVNTGRRVSMSHNWEFALGHVSDGWVTFLGDDDGMLPGGLARIAEVIEATRASAVVSQWRFYFWPDSSANANRLMIPCSGGYELRDSKKWLARLMHGQTDYHELPYIYTGGFADLKLINAARSNAGSFFCSMTPDVYSAIALASRTDRYVMLHEPVCVMGVSSHSNGASNLSQNGAKGPADLFFSEDNIPFHPALGSARVKSIPIIVYECYLQAMHLHEDQLEIELGEQLALALARARPEDRAQVRAYCEAVLQKSPSATRILPSEARLATTRLLAWLGGARTIPRRFDDLSVGAMTYHVRDVYGAALLSAHLYRFNKSGRNWRLKKAISFLGRQLGLVKSS